MKVAKIILINQKEELFFYFRDNKKSISFPGCWDLIGGGIEKNESPLEAIKREIKEEIDCEIKKISLIGKIYDSEHTKLFVFKGKIKKSLKDIKITEGQFGKFFKLGEIEKSDIPCFFKEFIFKNKGQIFC